MLVTALLVAGGGATVSSFSVAMLACDLSCGLQEEPVLFCVCGEDILWHTTSSLVRARATLIALIFHFPPLTPSFKCSSVPKYKQELCANSL